MGAIEPNGYIRAGCPTAGFRADLCGLACTIVCKGASD